MSRYRLLICITSIFVAMSGTAKAQELNAAETRALLAQGMWKTAGASGSTYYETYAPDGTLCIKENRAAEKCRDSGTWTREGAKVCYEYEWFHKSVGVHKACFYVARLDGNNYDYEAIDADNGLRLFRFTPLKVD